MSIRSKVKDLESRVDEIEATVGHPAENHPLWGYDLEATGVFAKIQDILNYLGIEYKTTPRETKLVKVTKKAKK